MSTPTCFFVPSRAVEFATGRFSLLGFTAGRCGTAMFTAGRPGAVFYVTGCSKAGFYAADLSRSVMLDLTVLGRWILVLVVQGPVAFAAGGLRWFLRLLTVLG